MTGCYSSIYGASEVCHQQCNPGTFQDTAGQSSCKSCPNGYVQPAYKSTACYPCPQGRYSNPAAGTLGSS
jgi:hypothetical protein